jgi:predicted nucleic acid-binding protein
VEVGFVTSAAFGSGVLIADTSVWQRTNHPALLAPWTAALRSGTIATCSIVTLELLYSTRTAVEFRAVEADQAILRDVPVSTSVQRAAIGALRALAGVRPQYHRVPLADALVAAAAQEAGIGVLHYDRHYDRLAEVLAFESRWAAPPGSL